MNSATPHFLLKSETSRDEGSGRWRFSLRSLDGSAEIAVADREPCVWGERLDLLTVVRALEALEQPSWVTLVACTHYVEQGILYGMAEWKENGWRWECFGQMVPVRDADLWQRMDQILQFHRVDCGQRRLDAAHHALQGPHWDHPKGGDPCEDGLTVGNWIKCHASALTILWASWLQLTAHAWRRFIGAGLTARG